MRRQLHSKVFHRSQGGQDVWVFGEVFDGMREGFFLDIGAHDGVYLSNTYVLEKRYNWNGICIEANPDSYIELKKNRQSTCVNICLDASEGHVEFLKNGVFGEIVSAGSNGYVNDARKSEDAVEKVRTKRLDVILDELQAPKKIDYMTIDIEGSEERVLKEFSFDKYRFICVTIERPTPLLKVTFNKNGYILIKEIPGLDCFYIHSDFIDQYLENVFSFYSKKYIAKCIG